MKFDRIPEALLLLLAFLFFAPLAMGQEDPGILRVQAAVKKAPDWDAVEPVPLKAEDLLGDWHGMSVERDYYSVWEIEYNEDGTYKMKGFDRMFDAEEEGKFEDSNWDLTGKWKIREDGILVCNDDVEAGDEQGFSLGPLWLKPVKVETEKLIYLTVYPEEKEASVAVIYEFKGKAPKLLKDLPPVESGVFKREEKIEDE